MGAGGPREGIPQGSPADWSQRMGGQGALGRQAWFSAPGTEGGWVHLPGGLLLQRADSPVLRGFISDGVCWISARGVERPGASSLGCYPGPVSSHPSPCLWGSASGSGQAPLWLRMGVTAALGFLVPTAPSTSWESRLESSFVVYTGDPAAPATGLPSGPMTTPGSGECQLAEWVSGWGWGRASWNQCNPSGLE